MYTKSGFNYFFNNLGIGSDSLRVFYDFKQNISSGQAIPSVESGKQQYSGTLNGVGDFYSISGSGSFDGSRNIKLNNVSGEFDKFWTLFVSFEKSTQKNGVLFSNYHENASQKSGFAIGVNDANKLYFESYDDNGAVIKTSNNIYSSKNAISISRSNNSLNFYYYDFNAKKIEYESFSLNGQYIFNSNDCYVGQALNPPSRFSGNGWSGYIDSFILINEVIPPNSIEKLFSGYFTDFVPGGQTVTYYTNFPVTGYTYGSFNVTGITGWQINYIGTDSSTCLPINSLFSIENLTGVTSNNQLIPLTGIQINAVTGNTPDSFINYSGYADSFGMNGVVFTRNFDVNDISLVVTPTGINGVTHYNILGTFNTVDNVFILDKERSGINLYVNGIAQLPSGISIGGDLYSPVTILSGDYNLSGYVVNFSGFISGSDRVMFDGINSTVSFRTLTDANFTGNVVTGFNANNTKVFLNGQLLISGLDYSGVTVSSITVASHFSGIYGTIYSFSNENVIGQMQTGVFPYKILDLFPRRSSQIWMNGQRQYINNDYYEISRTDLLSGSGVFGNFNYALYNNDGLFWN